MFGVIYKLSLKIISRVVSVLNCTRPVFQALLVFLEALEDGSVKMRCAACHGLQLLKVYFIASF